MTQRIIGTVAIADGQTVSDTIALGPETLSGLQIPDGFDGSTISFQASVAGQTFAALRIPSGDGDVYTIPVTAGSTVYLDPVVFNPFAFFKIVAGSSQTGAATIGWAAVRL